MRLTVCWRSDLSPFWSQLVLFSFSIDKCINPRTQRPVPAPLIEKAMRENLHYSVVPRRSAKQQALDVIRLLREKGFPIERAPMRLRIVSSSSDLLEESLKELTPLIKTAQKEPSGTAALIAVDPSAFKDVEKACAGKARVEVLSVAQKTEGETSV